MSYVKMASVQETARQILQEIEAEQLIKTAEQQIVRNTAPAVKTDLGQALIKVAAQCRGLAVNSEVTYNDLFAFVENAKRTA